MSDLLVGLLIGFFLGIGYTVLVLDYSARLYRAQHPLAKRTVESRRNSE